MSTVDSGAPNEVFGFGGRGFSIWESLDAFGLGGRVFESGDDFEVVNAHNYHLTFNGDSSTGTRTPVQEADSRSPNMVPVWGFGCLFFVVVVFFCVFFFWRGCLLKILVAHFFTLYCRSNYDSAMFFFI